MEVTKVFFKDYVSGTLIGFADVVFDDALVVRGFSIFNTNGRVWAKTPQEKCKDGEYRDKIHWNDKEWYQKDANPILKKIAEECEKRAGGSSSSSSSDSGSGDSEMDQAW